MISRLKTLLGIKPAPNYSQLLNEGGIIIDVRSKVEFSGGHIKGSKNIPLQALGAKRLSRYKDKPVIICCATGMRSGPARRMLRANGFTQVYNAGSWISLNNKIQ